MKTCYHCNDSCVEEIKFDNHTFCCVGCKTVYEILNGNEMDQYYDIEQNPGIKPGGAVKGQFSYLDLEEFKQKLISFEEGNITKIKFFIPQIHCSSCLWLLERLHQLKPGIIQSQVDFAKKETIITFNSEQISLREVAELCATIGYAPKITLEDYGEKKKSTTNRRLIIQIGVAGFCFGNIMLISFPEYLGLNETDANFQRLFGWLNLILSLPVLLFGAKDYLIAAYKALRAKTVSIDVPISLGILALYIRSVFEIVTESGAGYMDSFAGLIFFLLIGKWFQHQTYTAINFERDYASYFPISVARKIPDGEEEIIPLKKVNVGDRLIIRNNELIPTDAILIKGDARIDYSFVSGESALIAKKEGNKLFAGGRQEGPAIEVEVLKEVENSYLTQLWNNPIFDKEKDTVSLSDKISKYFTFIILGIALISGGVWYFIDSDQSVFIITSILIVACPCAIALSVPFTYGNSIRIFGRKSLYLRSTKVIEPMAAIDTFVFDKTGTLTQNHTASIEWEGSELSEADKKAVKTLVSHSAHPLSRKVAAFLSEQPGDLVNMQEKPGNGIQAEVKGNVWKVGSHVWVNVKATDNRTRVYVAKNDQFLGSFVFSNAYRSGIDRLFQELDKKGELHILSGDNDAEKAKLEKITPKGTTFCFNQKPQDKLNYIAKLRSEGKKVMMLGDGLNDAGALKQSDVGFSVVDDVYAFSPASDGIIAGEKLRHLSSYLNFSDYSKKVVKWSYIFSLLYNTAGLCFAVSGNLTPLVAAILMPLSSISVVLFVTLLTNIKARKLGVS